MVAVRCWVPEEIWKTPDVLAKLLTSLYKICDQSVGKRISHLSLTHFSVRETFNYPTEHKFWFPLPELHTDQSGSISNSILICLVRTGKWEVCCVASPHRSHSNCLAGWCWYSNTYILHIEKKIRDKSAFTGVRITLKPGQHQGTPACLH